MTKICSSDTSDPLAFKECFFAFLDILGFGDHILRNAASGEVVKQVNKLYETARQAVTEAKEGGAEVRISIFSDSIMLSAPSLADDTDEAREQLQQLIWCINKLTISILLQGFLVRGAIVKDALLHEDDLVLGPALIRAYQLETKTANFPRVIVSREARSVLPNDDNSWIKPSQDGPYFVDSLADLQSSVIAISDHGWNNAVGSAALETICRCRGILAEKLEAARDNPAHFAKASWFADYFDRSILSHGPCDRPEWPKLLIGT